MKKQIKIVMEIDNNGDISCLWTDEIDLFAIGRVANVRKASNVDFNETEQVWEVLSLEGEVLHQNKSREAAIEFEIEVFSPGGMYYEPK